MPAINLKIQTSPGRSVTQTRPPAAKAVIVSINYEGQQTRYYDEHTGRMFYWDMSLGGNHEAAQAMRDLLIDQYNYQPEDIVLLMDGSNWYAPPTAHNIISAMNWLVADAQDNDRFVFFFSGHGDQADAVDDRNEEDGKDEYIIPIDHEDRNRVILDNDIKKLLVEPIQHKKVNLVGIFDCCHSGTIMDLHEHIYNKDHEQNEQVESPQDMSPIVPVGPANTAAQQRMHEPRGRRFYPMPHQPHLVAVRKDPLGLKEGYAISSLSKEVEGKENAAVGGLHRENRRKEVSRSATHPLPQHTITWFTNNNAKRQASLPPVPRLEALDSHQPRGLAHNPAPGTSNSPLRNVTNVNVIVSEPATTVQVDYEACITSWSACADDEQNWENVRGEAMGTPMIQYLTDHPWPTYDELLTQLAAIMRENGRERQEAWRRAGLRERVIIQRPQLGSLKKLNLNDYITI